MDYCNINISEIARTALLTILISENVGVGVQSNILWNGEL